MNLIEKMEASNATSNDDIVINHFCRQIFHALGYPDKHTAIVRRKWRVAVSQTLSCQYLHHIN